MAKLPLPPQRPAPNPARELQAALQEGLRQQNAGKFEAARAIYEDILRRAPMQPDALNLLGIVLCERYDIAQGAEYLLRAAMMRPRDANVLNNLGNALIKNNRHRDAIDPLERAISLQPDLAEAYGNVIVAHRYAGNVEAALFYIDALTQLKGESVITQFERARLYADLGRREEARELSMKTAREHPQYGPAWHSLFELEKTKAGDPMLDDLLRAIEAAPEKSTALKYMCLAAGKAFDDLGEYDRAFDYFSRAKAQETIAFNLAEQQADFDSIKRVFDASFLAARQDWGLDEAPVRPVFIVGMPRSGTTLAEQILSSHRDVGGGGELEFLPYLCAHLAEYSRNDKPFPFAAQGLTPMGAAALGSAYVRQITSLNLGKRVVIDKMPHNFKQAGLIATMYRQPTIVHCARDPIDTCLSIYMHNFAATHTYSRSLEALAQYYNLYGDLMRHWDSALPAPMHTFSYEAVIADQEAQTKALLSHTRLDWDENVLSFHTTERRVATPSQWQVRAPLYSSSSGRWRRYEKHLEPLINALDPRYRP